MKKGILFSFIFYSVQVVAQGTITVNPLIQYQTIRGWGGTGGQNTQFEGTPPYLINQIINESVDGLGLTGLRYECYQGSYSQSYAMCRSWEWTNDNGSPDTTSWGAFDTTAVDNYMQNLFVPWKNKVVSNGEPFSFYESPSWYLNGSTGDIPAFLRYSPGEYAEYLISNLLYLRNKYGLTADYVTICNEAGNNNVFTPQLIDTMMQTVGPRLQTAGLSTKIQFPECVSAQTTWNYIQALQNDASVWPYVKCLSYHLYGTNDPYRSLINNFAQSKGIPTAQTEYVGLGIDLLFQDLTLGGVSYWDFYGNGDYMPLNANNTWFTHGAKFWTTRQLIRHVRPGAVRIDASSSDPTLKSVAFLNGGQITTVILNDSATSITQNVTISGLPAGNYAVGQTTGAGAYSELGVVNVGGSGNLTVSVNAQTVMAIYPHTVNLAPVATSWAAIPTYLDLPLSTVALSSSAVDPELTAITYHWTVDSFPGGANVVLSNANISNPSASGLTVPGNYVFGIHFNDGVNITTKQVTVQVFQNNQPPVISELQSRIPVIVTLPVDTTVLQGSAFDLEGDPLNMQFSVVNEPAGASAQLVVLQTAGNTTRSAARNMNVPGDYVFRFTVSDASHTVHRDITVTVYSLNNAPVISSVSANPITVSKSVGTTALAGITSDPDGDVITHWWLVTSAPAGAVPIFSTQGERTTTVSNLTIPGTYIFTLRVIDRTLFTSKNDTVIVNDSPPDTVITDTLVADTVLNFTAVLTAPETALLKWQTASEFNSSYFDVQRSTDGQTFSNIGRVNAAGNSNNLLNYSYTDNTISSLAGDPKTIYYRIGEVDKDGNEIFSPVDTVHPSGNNVSMIIGPNPVQNLLNVQFLNASGTAEIFVYDMIGRRISNQNSQIAQGNTLQINTSVLAIGCYYLQVKIMGLILEKKFVKD
jgi:O-glycosyl hydrolase